MKVKHVVQSLALLSLLCLPAAAQDKKSAPMDEKAMMDKMMQAGTPGAAHQKLEPLAGKFTVKSKMWSDPSKPPQESTGTAERNWILDKRFLEERFQGSYGGHPFTGIGTFGYDNVTKKYVGTWIDSMSTSVTTSKGSLDGKVLKYKGMMSDPMSGKEMPYTMHYTLTSNDSHTVEMWGAGPNGKQMKWMEMVYTRTR